MQPHQIGGLLEKIDGQMGIQAGAEITLEANPGTVDSHSLKAFRDAGINRISLGVQSFDDLLLKRLGRIHTADQARQAFIDARTAGFDNISIDLIHSLPCQSLEQWRTELQHAVKLNPEHISIYGLTIEEDTAFERMYPIGSPELADEDMSADMFECADELLTESGFDHYEIANYARHGYQSQHNSGYWQRDGYLGLGVAAHSFLHDGHGIRFNNPDKLEDYRLAVMSGQLPRINTCQLTENDARSEYMFLGLRLANGINLSDFAYKFGHSLDSIYGPVTAELARLGLIICDENRICLTRRGMLLSNQVFTRFLV
jgi:oxygen-independent coproporphyrinogen-3 oxidase